MTRAFTQTWPGLAIKIISDVEVGLPQSTNPDVPPTKTVKGLWDTGATGCCISQKLAKDLNLTSFGVCDVTGVGGTKPVPWFLINLYLPTGIRITDVQVTEAEGLINDEDILIGMNVIRIGDFAITNHGGKTQFTFRVPSVEPIDFVRETRERALKEKFMQEKAAREHNKKKKHR
ncbi:MAG: retroviral-like aspartic protease family protein [Bacteroidetes bacterium]|nr:retroviral-like aspartic protease family protein [Bacteroidota bacterium]